MSVVIPPGFGEATLVFAHTGVSRQARVIIGFDDEPGATPDAVAVRVRDATWSAWGVSFEDSVTLSETRVIVNRLGVMQVGSAGSTAAGTGGAFSVAGPQVAFKVYKRTALAGRHNRGAAFLPPWLQSESNITDAGQFSVATTAALQARADLWLTNLSSDGLSMFLLHDETAPSTTPTLVTSLVVSRLTATQRRRIRPLA